MAIVKVKSGLVTLPRQSSAGAAGYDIFAASAERIPPYGTGVIKTGLHLQIPPHTVLLVHSRSGQGFNHGIRLSNCTGVIDSDYRGELLVKLQNDSDKEFKVEVGDKVAQAILMPFFRMDFETVDELDETDRGTGGFGSTGK